jgi:type IV pilus assembly protein PilC
MVNDIQGGISMSQAMARHPDVFSKFYVNIIRIGEESGKLDEMFNHMADYMERNYELTSKAKNALLYPAFVVSTFVVIMILMLVVVIPRLAVVLSDLGGTLPIYTRILLGFSSFVKDSGIFLLIAIAIGAVFLWRYFQTVNGKMVASRIKISFPYIGDIYRKIYLARIADNLSTLLGSGIPVLSSLEITAEVVGNEVYRTILLEASEMVKSGSSISNAFAQYDDIPGLISQMVKIGEEGGKLTFVLDTMARFYKREVDNLVENLVGLIEPVMIVVLGLGVGFLVMAVLGPIYSITSTI